MDENDISFNISAIKFKSRRSSSLFKINVDGLVQDSAGPNKKSKNEYQQQLQKEIDDWYTLYYNGKIKLKVLSENSVTTVPLSVLNNEQMTYCLNGPNFNQHMQELTEFANEATFFLKSVASHFEWVSYLDEAIANKCKDMARNIIDKIDE